MTPRYCDDPERVGRHELGSRGDCHTCAMTIDITPTWTAVLPVLMAVLEDGTEAGRQIAREELGRMAGLADAYVILSGRKATPGVTQ